MRCSASNTNGGRCRRVCQSYYCWQHGGGASGLTVTYPSGTVNGNQMTKEATRSAPNVTWEGQGLFTLIMFDPDAPASKAQGKQWLHWLVFNIQGNQLSTGSTLQGYSGPTPPAGSGTHRYIIRLYEQGGQISPSGVSQSSFDVNAFASQNSLANPQEVMFTVAAQSGGGGGFCVIS